VLPPPPSPPSLPPGAFRFDAFRTRPWIFERSLLYVRSALSIFCPQLSKSHGCATPV